VGSPRSPVTVNLKLSRTFSFSTLAGTVACGEPQYLETFRAGADPGIILSVLVVQLVGRLGSDGFWDQDYGLGGGSGYAAILADAGGALYGTEIGSVTLCLCLKRIGFLCFPIKHSTVKKYERRQRPRNSDDKGSG